MHARLLLITLLSTFGYLALAAPLSYNPPSGDGWNLKIYKEEFPGPGSASSYVDSDWIDASNFNCLNSNTIHVLLNFNAPHSFSGRPILSAFWKTDGQIEQRPVQLKLGSYGWYDVDVGDAPAPQSIIEMSFATEVNSIDNPPFFVEFKHC